MLPVKKKNSLLEKIKGFFRRLFKNNSSLNTCTQNNVVNQKTDVKSNSSFTESIKTSISNEYLKNKSKEEFIKQLENNTSLLKNLSTDRLLSLNNYYEKIRIKKITKLIIKCNIQG